MNSFLFNAALISLCAFPVVQFCTGAFAAYARCAPRARPRAPRARRVLARAHARARARRTHRGFVPAPPSRAHGGSPSSCVDARAGDARRPRGRVHGVASANATRVAVAVAIESKRIDRHRVTRSVGRLSFVARSSHLAASDDRGTRATTLPSRSRSFVRARDRPCRRRGRRRTRRRRRDMDVPRVRTDRRRRGSRTARRGSERRRRCCDRRVFARGRSRRRARSRTVGRRRGWW